MWMGRWSLLKMANTLYPHNAEHKAHGSSGDVLRYALCAMHHEMSEVTTKWQGK